MTNYKPRVVCPNCGSKDNRYLRRTNTYWCRRCPTEFKQDGAIIKKEG